MDYLTLITDDYPTTETITMDEPQLSLGEQFLEENGMLWNATKLPMYIEDPVTGLTRTVPGHHANVRDDNNEVIGVTGARHTNYQNSQVVKLGDILAKEGDITWEKAGMFHGGASCYAQGKLQHQLEVVPGDKIDPYLTFTWAHDGSGSFKAFLTYIRIFCQNQSRAIAADMELLFKFRHTSSIQTNAERAAKLLTHADDAFIMLNNTMQELAQKHLSLQQFVDIVHVLYPDPEEGPTPTKTLNIRETISHLFYHGIGQQHPGVRNTAWAGLNAITEFTTHHKIARGDTTQDKQLSRLHSTFAGSSAKQEQKTLELLLAA